MVRVKPAVRPLGIALAAQSAREVTLYACSYVREGSEAHNPIARMMLRSVEIEAAEKKRAAEIVAYATEASDEVERLDSELTKSPPSLEWLSKLGMGSYTHEKPPGSEENRAARPILDYLM